MEELTAGTVLLVDEYNYSMLTHIACVVIEDETSPHADDISDDPDATNKPFFRVNWYSTAGDVVQTTVESCARLEPYREVESVEEAIRIVVDQRR